MLAKYLSKLESEGEVYIKVKARPGASKTVFKGLLDGEEEILKVDISAPPEKGKANIELLKYLSGILQVDKKNIKIISGAGDKIKLLKIITQR